ncbi:hypothetical protein [Bacillus sp. T33-2]|uniref:hypothetical protein n=1 Tax=Bacillus sp. T33-2 TaxID=2054168 RepID=UPI0015E1141B|nr:hypothetical protein [Bacillus sp. T33-2]
MTIALKNRKLLWFLGLVCLIAGSNYALYRWPAMQPLPDGVVLGSFADFLVVIPLMAYLLVIRKKYSLKYMGIVILAGYAAAYLIIPAEHFQQYSFVPWIIAASEGLLLLVELYILFKLLAGLPKLVRDYRTFSNGSSYFMLDLRAAVKKRYPGNKMLMVFLSEFSMFYYALFSWRKKPYHALGQMFTYHQKTSAVAVYVMLIHATILESVGLHYLLHHWNIWISYILLGLNVYGVIYFVAEIQATRLSPFLFTEDSLVLQVGLSKSMVLPLDKIKTVKFYDGAEKFSKEEQKTLFDARHIDFIQEKPMFDIELVTPESIHLLFGMQQSATRIVLSVDNQHDFYEALTNALKKESSKS